MDIYYIPLMYSCNCVYIPSVVYIKASKKFGD